MKVGSLVVLKDDAPYVGNHPGEKLPVQGVIYTVREFFCWKGIMALRLEEIINPHFYYQDGYHEQAFLADFFREVQPPMEIKLEELLAEHQPVTA